MSGKVIPEVLWAQRSSASDANKNFVYLTISVPDVSAEDLKLDLQPTGLKFEGESKTLKRLYHVDLDFFAEIDPAASKIHHTPKNVEIKLQKKELKSEYWPRLLKEAKKTHFLKTDFDKWVDEDEQEVAANDFGMGDFGGMPSMGGMGGMGGDFGGIDFSKLGGMGGTDEDGDSDEDLPDLEGGESDNKAAEPASTMGEIKEDAKVEEVTDDTPKVEEITEETPKA